MSVRYIAREELKKFLTGNELLREKKDRDAAEELMRYLRSDPDGSILCLNGVRLSGRTVMMHRAVMELDDYEQAGFVFIGSTEKGDTDRIANLCTEKKGSPNMSIIRMTLTFPNVGTRKSCLTTG